MSERITELEEKIARGEDRTDLAPFRSAGGPGARPDLVAPEKVQAMGEEYAREWLEGYAEQAERVYGARWRTLKF